MSDSDSKDSDEGIRYKTESVRNKTTTPISKESYRDSYYKDQTRSTSGKRYSRSPSPKKRSVKISSKHKRKSSKRSLSRSSSTSSSDNKSKSVEKESKRRDKYSERIDSYRTQTHQLKDHQNVTQKEQIGPAVPPHLLHKTTDLYKTENSKDVSSHEPKNKIEPRPPSLSIGPNLPPHMINKKPEYIGPSLPTDLRKVDDIVEQDHQSESQSLLLNDHKQVIQKEMIGPALPLHLLNKTTDSQDVSQEFKDKIEVPEPSPIGPTLPPHLINKEPEYIGPSLPINMRKVDDIIEQDQEISKDTFSQLVGPRLPPHLLNSTKNYELEQSSSSVSQENNSSKIIGPTLPPHLRKKLQEEVEENIAIANTMEAEEEDEDDFYGPLPAGISHNTSSHKALEERALQMKIDQLGPKESNEPVRETWMIELPAAKAANLGLGPRQFRNRSGPDMSDRSSWTNVPGDKNKKKNPETKVDLKAEAELKEIKRRDKEQEMLTKKHKRKEESLMKMHSDKLKKEKKDDGPSERRPFSREIDLQVNRFDEAQKKAIVKKAQLLDTRFSSGQSKYL